MKTIMRNGMVLYEDRPGVYSTHSESGANYIEYYTGEIIKARRNELKLSQQQLADRVGVNIGTISRYESGKIETVSHERLQQLAKALDCTIDYLHARTDDPHESFTTEYDPQTERVMEYFKRLSPDQKTAVEAIVKTMVQEE